jgi:hypothetical protein
MAEQEKKLGPNVTYTNPDKTAKMTTVAGVLLKEGQAVNLEERLGKEKSASILKKLANNPYFQVDGGPDHSKKMEEQGSAPNEEQAAWAVNEEARIRRTEGDEAADKFVESLDDDGLPKEQGASAQKASKAKQAEENYKAPEKEQLETPPSPPRRRPQE